MDEGSHFVPHCMSWMSGRSSGGAKCIIIVTSVISLQRKEVQPYLEPDIGSFGAFTLLWKFFVNQSVEINNK